MLLEGCGGVATAFEFLMFGVGDDVGYRVFFDILLIRSNLFDSCLLLYDILDILLFWIEGHLF